MPKKPTRSTLRLVVGIMLGASLGLIALAVWMIANDEGSPVFVAVAGSMLAAFASILAARSRKQP